jgi:hypothetical protein
MTDRGTHRHAPRHCPVCNDDLLLTRLTCPSCETELSGTFEACEFCALGAEERQLLRVFLASRGNLKDLQRHLGVSYPTARARFADLLVRLGIESEDDDADDDAEQQRLEVLEALAGGDIDADEAERRLEALQ